jgi:hypothetical protein
MGHTSQADRPSSIGLECSLMTNVPCPCCGHLTLSASSRFETCPVCRREDDGQDDAGARPQISPRRRVAAALRAAVVAHERGAFGDIGLLHDQLEGMSLEPADRDVSIAINFLDGWCDSSNHDWSYYEPLVAADWPALASRLAADLESGAPIADAVRDQFEFTPSSGPLAWVRDLFRK